MNDLTFMIFDSGYCIHNKQIVFPFEKKENVPFPALFFLLFHPTKGAILVDTGYAPRFYEETMTFPYSLYAKVTPVFTDQSKSAVSQLKKIGLNASDIKYIVISHFHADHVAGLKDFPQATFICSKKGFKDVKDRKGFSALNRAFIPNLIPDDFEHRVQFLEDKSFTAGKSLSHHELAELAKVFPSPIDLFSDGSVFAVNLSGHALGQYGLFFKTEGEFVFLIADAVWKSRSVKEGIFPSRLAHFLMNDVKSYKKNLFCLHEYALKFPHVRIIPSHCEQAYLNYCAIDSNYGNR